MARYLLALKDLMEDSDGKVSSLETLKAYLCKAAHAKLEKNLEESVRKEREEAFRTWASSLSTAGATMAAVGGATWLPGLAYWTSLGLAGPALFTPLGAIALGPVVITILIGAVAGTVTYQVTKAPEKEDDDDWTIIEN